MQRLRRPRPHTTRLLLTSRIFPHFAQVIPACTFSLCRLGFILVVSRARVRLYLQVRVSTVHTRMHSSNLKIKIRIRYEHHQTNQTHLLDAALMMSTMKILWQNGHAPYFLLSHPARTYRVSTFKMPQ